MNTSNTSISPAANIFKNNDCVSLVKINKPIHMIVQNLDNKFIIKNSKRKGSVKDKNQSPYKDDESYCNESVNSEKQTPHLPYKSNNANCIKIELPKIHIDKLYNEDEGAFNLKFRKSIYRYRNEVDTKDSTIASDENIGIGTKITRKLALKDRGKNYIRANDEICYGNFEKIFTNDCIKESINSPEKFLKSSQNLKAGNFSRKKISMSINRSINNNSCMSSFAKVSAKNNEILNDKLSIKNNKKLIVKMKNSLQK